jgi:hypothetical protein
MFRVSMILANLVAIALLTGLVASAAAQAPPTAAEDVPANLVPPSGSILLFELDARGVQVYTCKADPDDSTAPVWALKGPEAELLNARGEVVGSHFAGPTWQVLDGSAVVGQVLERADAPEAGAIPWLLLEAKEHAGSGVFSMITHVQRLDTVGGTAPTEGCNENHVGEEVRVPYEATYAFFYPFYPTVPATSGVAAPAA